jgi:addiction module RelE/StbE family toxin
MASLRYTARFKRDYLRGAAKGCDPKKLKSLLELLRRSAPLPLGSRDAAAGNAQARTCRVEPGWTLVYRVKEGEVILLRLQYSRKDRPKAAPPMGLWFRTLLRSPVKTALTVLLLAAAAFLLLDNLSSYAMQTEAIKQAEAAVEGVLTVERSPVSEPAEGKWNRFLLTELGESYRWMTYESMHHEALSAADLEALESLPYIDAVDKRYMTAGVSEEYLRNDCSIEQYNYTDRLVIEATVSGIYPSEAMAVYNSMKEIRLKDVTLLAGNRRYIDEQLAFLGDMVRLIYYPVSETSEDYGSFVFMGGSGYTAQSLDYDITEDMVGPLEKGRRYVFVVRAPRNKANDSDSYGFYLGDDSLRGWWPYVTDVTDLPENYLETADFAPLRQLMQVTNDDIHTFDVVYTDDMASIRRVTRQQLTAVQGRLLGPEDAGKNVCVVNETFLNNNGLQLGDSVTLKLGNVLVEQYLYLGAVAVARDRHADEWIEQSFTIVGVWYDSSDRGWRDHEYYRYYSVGSWQGQDPYWAYSDNAIFVPTAFLPASSDTKNHLFRPAEVSFVVRDAANIGAFAEESLPLVEEMGLSYSWNDANWPIVAEKMGETRNLTLLKLLIFTAASVLSVGLTLYLFLHRRRKEYAVLRALGTPRRAAARALWLPLMALAVLSAFMGLSGAWLRSDAAAARSAAEFAEAGLEAMPQAHFTVYLLGTLGILAITALLSLLYLRGLGKRSPLQLLQDSERRKEKTAEAAAEISQEAMAHAAAVLAVPVTATGKPIKGFLRRYVLRHIRRAGAKTLLALLLAALLVGAVGQLTVMRSRYAELAATVQVNACFYDGLTYNKAKTLMKSGLLHDPVCRKLYQESEAELEFSPARVVFTNRLELEITAPVSWLEGWDAERADDACEMICILPAPVMEELGVKLGDKVRVDEAACISHLVTGHPEVVARTWEEMLALRDRYRNFYTVVGQVETEDTDYVVYAPAEAFQYYSCLGYVLYLDSAVFTLNDYHDADRVRQMAAEIQYTVKKPPVFSMDTSDADRIYRVYRLIETLYPLTVAAALILGTLLPVLMILQEQKEAAILRALGWSKKLTIRRLTLEQAALCLAGLVLALLALFAVNGSGFLGVIAVPLVYVAAHFALCVGASAAISASILQKSPMRLLQVKE